MRQRKGNPTGTKNSSNRINTNNCQEGEERQRDLQEIIPGIVIGGRFMPSSLDGVGATNNPPPRSSDSRGCENQILRL